jgi:hypothetical protein
LTVVFEHSGATNLGTNPLPSRSFHRQLFGGDIAFGYRRMWFGTASFRRRSRSFQSRLFPFADRAVGGVQSLANTSGSSSLIPAALLLTEAIGPIADPTTAVQCRPSQGGRASTAADELVNDA